MAKIWYAARAAIRCALVGALMATIMVATATAASAHVTVDPGSSTPGSFTKLTFRVPTESDTASTVSVTAHLPTDHPFPIVSVLQIPGWTATVHTVDLNSPVTEGTFTLSTVTDAVTWTADDGVGIKPGEFAEFAVSVGPVPDVDSLMLPTEQHYSDGTVVKWDEAASDDAAEPDHPAPVLTVAATSPAEIAASPSDTPREDMTTLALSLAALVLAAFAVLMAAVAVRRSRGIAHHSRP